MLLEIWIIQYFAKCQKSIGNSRNTSFVKVLMYNAKSGQYMLKTVD